jgi:hypothetical protein
MNDSGIIAPAPIWLLNSQLRDPTIAIGYGGPQTTLSPTERLSPKTTNTINSDCRTGVLNIAETMRQAANLISARALPTVTASNYNTRE